MKLFFLIAVYVVVQSLVSINLNVIIQLIV